ncbi:hypothetical protein EG329_012364 [Mollisiaceae sp. DMI_Dod_QoI]|nr:hypothetical protein EG329_012364 [Helotiales sp. DMI_Dod_QoI]
MATKKHRASERIAFFFEKYATLSREECDAIAASIDPTCLSPTSIQGAFSYTLVGASQVVQFRAKISPLNLSLVDIAKSIHGHLVARTFQFGIFGDESKGENVVLVYCMERLQGENFSLLTASTQLDALQHQKQERTVEGLARFFAQSWKHPQPKTNEMVEKIHSGFSQKLELLATNLPSRHHRLVQHCQKNLQYLSLPEIPWTITHGDLCDTNLLVDSLTGTLTGVPDWAEAEVLPFGLALWGLQTLLGSMDEAESRWLYFSEYASLESIFWAEFTKNIASLSEKQWMGIRIGHLLGLLCRHGFKFTGTGEIPKDDSWDLRILDGQLLANEKKWLESD